MQYAQVMDFTICNNVQGTHLHQLVLTLCCSKHLPYSSMSDIFGNATRKPPVKAGRGGEGREGVVRRRRVGRE